MPTAPSAEATKAVEDAHIHDIAQDILDGEIMEVLSGALVLMPLAMSSEEMRRIKAMQKRGVDKLLSKFVDSVDSMWQNRFFGKCWSTTLFSRQFSR